MPIRGKKQKNDFWIEQKKINSAPNPCHICLIWANLWYFYFFIILDIFCNFFFIFGDTYCYFCAILSFLCKYYPLKWPISIFIKSLKNDCYIQRMLKIPQILGKLPTSWIETCFNHQYFAQSNDCIIDFPFRINGFVSILLSVFRFSDSTKMEYANRSAVRKWQKKIRKSSCNLNLISYFF